MTDQHDRRTAGIFVRVEPPLKAALEQLAREDGRSVSSLLRKIAAQHARRLTEKAEKAAA